MADYDYAGVFIEEPQVGIRSIRGVETAIPAFVGHAKRAADPDNTPWFIHGWDQYEKLFGGLDSSYMMGYAVHHFFSVAGEGDNKCVVKRHDLATMAQASWTPTASASDSEAFTIYARSKNADQNNYLFTIGSASRSVSGEFKLTIEDNTGGTTATVEIWDNISCTSSSDNYLLKKVGQADQYISQNVYAAAGCINTGGAACIPAYTYYSQSGWAGTGDYSGAAQSLNDLATTSLAGLAGIPEVTILATPDHTSSADILEGVAFVETRADMIYVVDIPSGKTPDTARTWVLDDVGLSSNRVAAYWPHVYVNDPSRSEAILVPPCGYVTGIMAKTDANRGVWKAPAGVVDGRMVGVLGTEYDRLTGSEKGTLYTTNINPIEFKRGIGYCIMGSRMLAADPIWWQVPHRRLFDYVERSIEEGTQWAIFEPNDQTLWDKITLSATSFLMSKWREGAFYDGGTGDWRKAFFVKCDSTTNPESSVSEGKVITQIGIAPVRPAEFVIFQVSQWDGGRLVEELGLQGTSF